MNAHSRACACLSGLHGLRLRGLSRARCAATAHRLHRSHAPCPLLAEKQLADPSQRIHKVLETARVLYGLIHGRYILTAQGLSDMKAKYKACEFGACPRTLCEKQTVLPVGLSDSVSLSGDNPMKLYCARCRELYDHNVPGGNYIDGAFFGSTFPHLFLQTYSELRPPACSRTYVPRVFGFKVHQSVIGGSSSSGPPPPPFEEWPKRPNNEPISDWDS